MRRATAAIALALTTTLATGCAWRTVRAPRPSALLLPCAGAHCLRVVTWNLHAIPFMSPNPSARLRNVALVLREQQPDVVLLQELWAHAYPRRLAALLGGDYRVTTAGGCGRPFPCGGLAVLVRTGSGWSAAAPSFVPYDATAPWYHLTEWDGIAKKGILMLRLTRGDEAVGILDTHLQTDYPRHGHDYSDVRRRQLEQLDWTLRATFGERPTIVGGDFNTGTREATFASHVLPLGDDRTAEFRAACGECGTNVPVLKPPRWIDYVITRHLAAAATLARLANDTTDQPFSDHDGLLIRLEYDPDALR